MSNPSKEPHSGRNVGIDLLRIVAMLMVVCLHYLTHGGVLEETLAVGELNWFTANVAQAACLVAVNCFVLISGYYLCTARFRLKKLIRIYIQALFYSMMLCIVTVLLGGDVSDKELIKSIMPLTMRRYWFVTDYLLLYALFPFLNCAIHNMNRKKHFACCLVLLSIFCVLSNVVYISDFARVQNGFSMVWFCILYIVAAYIRYYVPANNYRRKMAFLIYGISVGIIAVERFAAIYLTPYLFGEVVAENLFYSYNSVFTATASIALFLAMRAITTQKRRLLRMISFFSKLSFGVYLIHDHPQFKMWIWDILNPPMVAHTLWLIPHMLLCAAMVFCVCCMVEWLRNWVFDTWGISCWIDATCDRVQQWISKKLDAMDTSFGEA